MKVVARAIVLVTVLVAAAVAGPPANADEAPGVYDIAVPGGAILPAGSMTVTWRAVIPAGGTTDGSANCHLSIDGVERAMSFCTSGEPFTYDLGTITGTPTVTLEVDQFYGDPATPSYLLVVTGTTTAWVDAQAPTAGVTAFTLTNGVDQAPNPMRPATAYRASLVWNDNLAVTRESCWIERTSPAPTVTVSPVTCSQGSSHGGSAAFTTPSSSGTYSFVLEVQDPVGHTARATRPFLVDATPPAVTVTSGPVDGGVTNAINVSWAWTSDDANAVYACWVGPQGDAPVLTGCSSSASFNGAPEGSYQLVIKATDPYANSATSTIGFTIDRTKPTVSVVSPTGSDPRPPGSVDVVVQASEPATYLCSSDPAAVSPTYAACGSAVPSTSYHASFLWSDFGTHQLGVKAVDAAGNASDPAVVTVVVAPPITGSATIAGASRVGSTLTVAGTWTTGAARSYQWRRDGIDIPGASAGTYLLTAKDLGHRISVRVDATLSGYVPTTVDSPAVTIAAGILSSGRARISGKLKVGRKLTASASPWAPGTTVRYQWYVGRKKVAGATRAQLTLTKKAAGKRIKVVITGSRPGYASRVQTVVARGAVRR
jgi:hypothetical protein